MTCSACRPVARMMALVVLVLSLLGAGSAWAESYLLIPMDLAQKNHLRAYGVAFHTLQANEKVNWLLNYRGGSFLINDNPRVRLDARLLGVSFESVSESQVADIRQIVKQENME